ncbi:flavodoxin family protein [uncultured Clostridium sp.]|uniref:flavodoxin family protein n=1 Tax=uncultured Clostridium sp. TaxID=59620 RepID=UPI0025F6BA4C|nr:flavodoxin family protein [uncultured Clostridium sp.]MDU4883444.1 flavodoxin family protein [Clostridium celatum]MDU7076507.1 flavodoxin family protein [Clostridium celatum]
MGKVLGLSFGRKMKNTDIMIKTALMECEKEGHEVQFIRVDDLDIKICTGCISCVVGMVSGRGKGGCPVKDDFHILDEALMECDAVIVGSPTYVLSPTGRFKTVCDRIGPSHDITFRKATYEEGLADGKDKSLLPDERTFKKRVGALVSVGGAMTGNWLSFMLPTMYEFTMSMGIDVIDMHQYHGAMAYEHVIGNEAEMDRMRSLGQNIANALSAEDEEERVKWRGDYNGVCPVCHCNMINVSENGISVECPVCGIEGKAFIEGNKIKIDFPKENQERSRLFWRGKLEHSTEIKTQAIGPGQIKNLNELLEKYKEYPRKLKD